MSDPQEPDINYLTELMNVFKNQTPSAPDWFRVIDQVVGTLLVAEMARAERRANPLSTE